MANWQRMVTTIAIWTALVITMSFPYLDSVVSVGVLIAATMSTMAVWFGGNTQVRETEKAKLNQRDRISRLVHQMDDQEVAELGALLSQQEEYSTRR